MLADDTGYGDPGCYNPQSLIPTPNIDRLAAEGLKFTDAHSPSALCTPTRYGLLTGRYYWRTPKKHALVMPYEPPVIESWRPTLPKMLRGAGYGTACIGKWHLGLEYPSGSSDGESNTQIEADIDFTKPLRGGPTDAGFDYFFGTAGCSTSDPPYCFIENDRTVGVPTVASTDDLHKLPGFYPGLMAEDWSEEEVDATHVEKAIEFIDRHVAERTEDPFFLYLALSAPHNPWLAPDLAKGRSKEGPRGDMNVLVDWCVGEVYRSLEERGILDDTLVVFTSDNGPMKGEGAQHSAGALRGYKNTAFEGGHRVPFIARWPGHVPVDEESDTLICLTDFYRTFADLAGITPDDTTALDSYSMLPSLLGGTEEPAERPSLVSDTGGFASTKGDFAIRSGTWKLIILADTDRDPMARRKVPIDDAVDGRLLFDLADDPDEENNLIEREPEIASRLARLLAQIQEKGSRNADVSAIMG